MDRRFLDHFQNPRNVGVISGECARVQVENPVCGDRLEVDLKLEGGRVELAFRVDGCSGSIAAASVMSELAQGATAKGAKQVGVEQISEALGGLPALKRHGADLACEGLRAALKAAEGNA